MRLENTFVGARGIGETTERDLWRQGVTHWDDFDRSVLGGKRGRRLEDFIEEARDRLADDDARFFDDALPNGERCGSTRTSGRMPVFSTSRRPGWITTATS